MLAGMPDLLRRLISPASHAIERDQVALTLADGGQLQIQRVRDPRAKRIRLSVDERGARLTLPPRASLIAGERFLQQHRDWLLMQLQRHSGHEDFPPLQRGQSAFLPLRGERVPLQWHDGRFARLLHAGDGLHFHLPPAAGATAMRRALREFYEAEARTDIGRWLPGYLSALPRPPRRILLKVMSSQWGSLAPDGSLALDLALLLGKPAAFEYVLVHELCHLIHANHSARFWHEVEIRCPDWRDQREYFHHEGRRLKAALRGLLAGASEG